MGGVSAVEAPSSPNLQQARSASPPPPALRDIETRYQVAEERSERWSPKLFGAIPVGEIGGSRTLTVTEGKLLDRLTFDRGIVGLQRFRGIADDAFATADARVPPLRTSAIPAAVETKIQALPAADQQRVRDAWPRNDGHNDAFRHAYWNARLTAEFGESWTREFTTAHEGSNPGSSTREAMDLYNNEIGRRIATEHPGASPAELADHVRAALDGGELVVIDRSGHLTWSNTVANGDHGVTIDLPGARAQIDTPDGTASAR